MEEILEQLIKGSSLHKEIYTKLGVSSEKTSVFDDIIQLANKVSRQLSENENVDTNYNRLYTDQANRMLSEMQFRGHENSNFVEHQNEHWKTQISQQFDNYLYQHFNNHAKSLKFQVDFFEKIGNFNSNIVLVGANGSGKTSISEKLKEYLNNNGVVISAQRILLLPAFETVSNPVVTASKLKKEQTRIKTYKDQDQFRFISSEFEIVLKHLLAENIAVGNKYRKDAFEKVKVGETIEAPQKTNLDLAFEIWNSLIEHRYLDCSDGINIKTFIKGEVTSYPSIQMSDGEKVLLYLISQVLLAPENGFIVIDEPEMYLHKTILKKLWDELEATRNDCLFIYLTHDLDFATSRNTAKKIWIKSYTYPDFWEMEQIQTNEIPETLLLELLGSRKNILFCEGTKGSLDEKIYSLLFPNYTITSVGSCFNVMNHTKAFNKLAEVHTKAYGLIDTDHHSDERLQKIKEDNIFSFGVSEVENLFLDEDFLKSFAEVFLSDNSKIELIKTDVLRELEREKELQISNYISAKINNIFTDTDLSKGNTLDKVKQNYSSFLDEIKIDDFYSKRQTEIEEIISNKNYELAISIFNNKGLKRIPSHHFGVTDFTEKCFKLLKNDPEKIEFFRKYFPSEL